MSRVVRSKGMGLMFLSMGVLTLLLATYFIVNSKSGFNSTIGAHKKTTVVGMLRSDPKHEYYCNDETKAEFVIEFIGGTCVPIITNTSLASQYVNSDVEISGDMIDNKYYVVGFKRVNPRVTPFPKNSPKPVRTPTNKIIIPVPTSINVVF